MSANNQLPLETVKKAIESAFEPLRCVVEVYDYGTRLRFRVFDSDDQPVLKMEDILVELIYDPGKLRIVIGPLRRRLQNRGYKLEKWTVPTV